MSNKSYSEIPWWAIALGFMFSWPIGLVLLFMSLGGVKLPTPRTWQKNWERWTGGTAFSAGQSAGQHANQPPSASANHTGGQKKTQTPPTASGGTAKETGSGVYHGEYSYGYSYGYGKRESGHSGPSQPPRRARKFKKPRSGKLMSFCGGLISFVFAIGLADELSDVMENGVLATLDEWFPVFGFLCAGLFLLGKGISTNRWSRRAKLYQNVIGQRNSIFLSDLAATTGVDEKKLLSDLERMLADGMLPQGYVDRASGRLVLTDLNPAPEPEADPKAKPKREPEPEKPKAKKENADDAILRQIQEVNDAIPDPVMSQKIERIEEITRKILAYQKKNPAKSDQLRQFLNYYLPTTLKILNAYAQMDAQGVEGENISAAKKRIEGMMDKVVEGFEKQLDQLFQADAMDITTDVEVLERMLDRDGLGSGMTIGGL